MKISELQELLEEAKEAYGDVEILMKHSEPESCYTGVHRIDDVWYGNS